MTGACHAPVDGRQGKALADTAPRNSRPHRKIRRLGDGWQLKFDDGTMIAIDTIAVENEIADNMYQRSELDYLIYNDPVAYADLILNGDPEIYLKTVTEYKPLDS